MRVIDGRLTGGQPSFAVVAAGGYAAGIVVRARLIYDDKEGTSNGLAVFPTRASAEKHLARMFEPWNFTVTEIRG